MNRGWKVFLNGSLTVKRALLVKTGLAGTASALLSYYIVSDTIQATDMCAEAPAYPWPHNGIFSSLDHASVRRGYEVYKQVCKACHSMKFVSFRHLVGVTHTVKQAKTEAAEAEIEDGPNDQGEMYTRPGKLTDRFPNPYKNNVAAKLANNGALPPDLTFINLAREGGSDYIYSLLTGYRDRPAGVPDSETTHFNPYFTGTEIGMQAPLYDEIIEYEDGTPATLSQLAKDICSFLTWSSQMEHDQRKFLALKVLMILPVLTLIAAHFKRVKWSSVKTRKLQFVLPKKKYQE